jgi:hypothetical protein
MRARQRAQRFWAGLFCAGLVAVGCNDENGPPAIVIQSPLPGTIVNVQADNQVPITVRVRNFNLKSPGGCGNDVNCGQIYLNVDGDACNIPGKAYNAIAPTNGSGNSTTVVNADLSFCPPTSIAGNHRISASLHRTDGGTVIGAENAPALAEITITTGSGSVPTQ